MRCHVQSLLFFIIVQLLFTGGVYSQQVPDSSISVAKYHYCKIQIERRGGMQSYLFDFGDNAFYNTEMGLDTLKRQKSIVIILNRMSDFGWELINAFVETDYFYSTPQNTQNWILRKKVSKN